MVNSLSCAANKNSVSASRPPEAAIHAGGTTVNDIIMSAVTATNATSSAANNNDHDIKDNPVKMEVLDDLFGGYAWDDSPVASTAPPFLMSPTSSINHVAVSKCTVKVPTESEFEESAPPPNLSAFNLAAVTAAAAAGINNEQPLRVIIPSPLPPGPDTTTTNSPSANNNLTPVDPLAATPASNASTGSSVASAAATSSGKKTVFTAKGRLCIFFEAGNTAVVLWLFLQRVPFLLPRHDDDDWLAWHSSDSSWNLTRITML